jgi:hypothetical protein
MRELRNGAAMRKVFAALILTAAAATQILFNNLPWPLQVEEDEKLKNPSASARALQFVFTGATLRGGHPLLAYDGVDGETVDLDFKAARPDEQTAAAVFALAPSGAPPAGAGVWRLVTRESAKDRNGPACRAHLEITAAEGPALGELHFTQLADPAVDHRVIDIIADSATLLVKFKNEAPEPGRPYGPGCLKVASSGAWQTPVRNAPVAFRVPPGSHFWITFVAETDRPVWRGSEGVLRTARLGSLGASEVTLRPIREDGEPEKRPAALRLRGVRGSLLAIKGLQIGLDSLQVSLEGKAWAQKDGHTVGFDLWDAMQKNFILATLLAAGNGLLLHWVRKLFFGADPPKESAQASVSA